MCSEGRHTITETTDACEWSRLPVDVWSNHECTHFLAVPNRGCRVNSDVGAQGPQSTHICKQKSRDATRRCAESAGGARESCLFSQGVGITIFICASFRKARPEMRASPLRPRLKRCRSAVSPADEKCCAGQFKEI